MNDKNFCCYEFGAFKLDARRRSLSKNGENVPLASRNFDLLLFMVENGGRILEHDELLDKVWAGTFVEQATLKKGISALRQILGETAENEYIKTIPRRGYSFVSPVRVVPEKGEPVFVRETEQEIIVEEYEETEEPQNFSAAKALEIPSAATQKSSLPRLAIIGAAGVIAVVLTFFGVKTYFSASSKPQFSAENVRINRITNNGKVTSGTAVSADGNYVLYPTNEKDGTVLWIRQISTNSATKLTAPMSGVFWGFAIAPDNSYVYYIANNTAEPQKSGLYKIPLLGGEPQRIAQNVSTVAVSPDSKRLATVRIKDDTKIFTLDSNGENEHEVKSLTDDSRLWSVRWTADGKNLLCALRKTVADKNLYYVAEVSPENGAENVVLPAQERVILGAQWMPDQSALILVVRESNAEIRQIWQYLPSSQEWRRITNDNNYYQSIDITRDGKTIVSSQHSRLASIWLSNVKSPENPGKKSLLMSRNDFRQLTEGANYLDKIAWLANERLAYSANDNGKETIFIINSDGANAHQITDGEDGMWVFPAATGDNQSISFLSSRSGTRQIWRIDAEGKNPSKMTDSGVAPVTGRILRDNSTVIYQKPTSMGGPKLFKQTADGQTIQLTEAETGAWAISPDEKLLAVETLDTNTRRLYVELRSLEDGKIIKTFNFSSVRQLTFTPDGKNLTYDTKSSDASQLMLQPLEGGEPQPLTDFQTDDIFSFAWSPDGTRLAMIRGRQLTDVVLIRANTP